MLIQVQYRNNSFDYVKDNMLHKLIESKKIVRFRRSSGWVTVGVDSVRQFNRGFHSKENSYQNPMVEVKDVIRVVYNDNSCDYITNALLDNLLESKKIAQFQRATGWVTVGFDPIRKTTRKHTYNTYPNKLKKRLS